MAIKQIRKKCYQHYNLLLPPKLPGDSTQHWILNRTFKIWQISVNLLQTKRSILNGLNRKTKHTLDVERSRQTPDMGHHVNDTNVNFFGFRVHVFGRRLSLLSELPLHYHTHTQIFVDQQSAAPRYQHNVKVLTCSIKHYLMSVTLSYSFYCTSAFCRYLPVSNFQFSCFVIFCILM